MLTRRDKNIYSDVQYSPHTNGMCVYFKKIIHKLCRWKNIDLSFDTNTDRPYTHTDDFRYRHINKECNYFDEKNKRDHSFRFMLNICNDAEHKKALDERDLVCRMYNIFIPHRLTHVYTLTHGNIDRYTYTFLMYNYRISKILYSEMFSRIISYICYNTYYILSIKKKNFDGKEIHMYISEDSIHKKYNKINESIYFIYDIFYNYINRLLYAYQKDIYITDKHTLSDCVMSILNTYNTGIDKIHKKNIMEIVKSNIIFVPPKYKMLHKRIHYLFKSLIKYINTV